MTPRARYLLLKWRAWVLLALARPNAARPLFDQMLALAPGDAYALASRAHLRAAAGERAQAIADYEELVRTHAQHATAWFNLGYLQVRTNQRDRARESLREALRCAPGNKAAKDLLDQLR